MIKHELLESPETAYDLYYVGDAMSARSRIKIMFMRFVNDRIKRILLVYPYHANVFCDELYAVAGNNMVDRNVQYQ